MPATRLAVRARARAAPAPSMVAYLWAPSNAHLVVGGCIARARAPRVVGPPDCLLAPTAFHGPASLASADTPSCTIVSVCAPPRFPQVWPAAAAGLHAGNGAGVHALRQVEGVRLLLRERPLHVSLGTHSAHLRRPSSQSEQEVVAAPQIIVAHALLNICRGRGGATDHSSSDTGPAPPVYLLPCACAGPRDLAHSHWSIRGPTVLHSHLA